MKPVRPPRGFAIVSGIFILLVLAGLGAAILTISTNQQIGSALDVQGVQAYQAARSGVEWGLYQQLRTTSCAASTSFVPPAASLADFTVTVTCAATADPDGGPPVFSLTSTACNQPSGGSCPNTTNPGDLYVERRLAVSF